MDLTEEIKIENKPLKSFLDMNTIEKLKEGFYNLSEFNESQILFITGLVNFAYVDGINDAKYEIKDEIESKIQDFKNNLTESFEKLF